MMHASVEACLSMLNKVMLHVEKDLKKMQRLFVGVLSRITCQIKRAPSTLKRVTWWSRNCCHICIIQQNRQRLRSIKTLDLPTQINFLHSLQPTRIRSVNAKVLPSRQCFCPNIVSSAEQSAIISTNSLELIFQFFVHNSYTPCFPALLTRGLAIYNFSILISTPLPLILL